MQARHTRVKLKYDDKDISEDIARFLIDFSFEDSYSNEADNISITLEDRPELWENDWFPSRGSALIASFIVTNWLADGDVEIPLGTFEIDSIEVRGLAHTVKIEAVSVPYNNDLRGVQRNKSWEKIKLSAVAKEIADRAGMRLYLNLRDDTEIDRLEQREESDLAFLIRIAKEKGYGVRVSDEQLDVYYLPDLDVAEPVETINKYKSKLSSYSFKAKARDVYKAAHVRYENSKKGILIEYTFTDPNKKGGQVLEIHQQVEDVAAAEKLAKSQLREKNKDEVTCKIEFAVLENVSESDTNQSEIRNLFLAGLTVQLEGFHVFDGKYVVEKSSHSYNKSSGYRCSINARKALEGY